MERTDASYRTGLPMNGERYLPFPEEAPEGWPLEYVAAADYEELAARCEALEKDAARYRWLRDHDWTEEYVDYWDKNLNDHQDIIDGEWLDGAIDAAMTPADHGCSVRRVSDADAAAIDEAVRTGRICICNAENVTGDCPMHGEIK